MKQRWKTYWALIFTSWLLAATCAAQTEDNTATPCTEGMTGFIEALVKESATQHKDVDDTLDSFLDRCLVKLDDASDPTLKTYRGYVVLALLSRYAAFNYTGHVGGVANLDFQTYPELNGDAVELLSHIGRAERLLRMASGNPAVAGTVDLSKGDPAIEYTKLLDSDKAVLPDVSRLIRTLSVLQVAVDAGKPTVRRTSSFFRRAIVNAVADREELLRQGLTAMGKGFTLSIFGSAYLKDGGRHLQTCKDQAGATCPSTDNWKYWSRIIEFSCNQIATATGATHQCLGDWSTTPPH